MSRFTLIQLDEKAKSRPQGYREEVLRLAGAPRNDGFYELSDELFAQLADKYRAPTFFDKLANVSTAAFQALSDPSARSLEELRAVTAICRQCPWFIEERFACGHCGCNLHIKPTLKTWHCPVGKW